MIHIGKNTKSRIVSKGISGGNNQDSYSVLVKVTKKADNARNHSQCDSLLLTDHCGAHTFPYTDIQHPSAVLEHEATTSKISEIGRASCRGKSVDIGGRWIIIKKEEKNNK